MSTPLAEDVTQQLRRLVQTGRFGDALARYQRIEATPDGRRPEAQLLAATAATRVGELALGESMVADALERFRSRGDADGRLRALNLLGVVSWERGRMREAEEYLAQALNLARYLGDSLMVARACNNMASAIHLRGRADEAVGLYRGALLAYQRLGDRRGTAETYHNLGLIYRQLGLWREAEDAVHEAVRHAEMVGEKGLLALVLVGRAELRVDQGELPLAYPDLDRAGALAAGASDEIGGAEVRRVRALAALKAAEFERALADAEAASRIARAYDSALLGAECAALAALALRALHRQPDAEARRHEADEGFRALGALTLQRRFEADWNAAAPASKSQG